MMGVQMIQMLAMELMLADEKEVDAVVERLQSAPEDYNETKLQTQARKTAEIMIQAAIDSLKCSKKPV